MKLSRKAAAAVLAAALTLSLCVISALPGGQPRMDAMTYNIDTLPARDLRPVVDGPETEADYTPPAQAIHTAAQENRDILIQTVAGVMASTIVSIANFMQFAAIFGMGRSSEDGEGGGSNPLMAIVLAILAPIAASLIQFAISRSREYLADASGARYCGQPLALAAALGKLQSWNQRIPMQNGNPTTAEMFIVAPLFGGGMAKLFSTHPDINDRIARLREMAGVR